MKLDQDFKKEVDREISEATYVTKRIVIRVLIFLLVIGILGGAWWGTTKYISTNADRVIFKQSLAYNEGMLRDLAKYKYEYETTSDDISKKAIADLIRSKYANFDKSKIDNKELKVFLEEMEN